MINLVLILEKILSYYSSEILHYQFMETKVIIIHDGSDDEKC